MAVTNRAKKQDKLPSWAQKGKLRLAHVFGGPLDTARTILAGRWNHSLKELLSANRYGPELVEELTARKFNAVCLTWSAGFSHAGEATQREIVLTNLIPLLKKKKIKAIASISVSAGYIDDLVKEIPEAHAWRLLGENLTPMRDEEGSQYFKMDLHCEGWRNYLGEKVRSALDAGFDGLFFDDSLAGDTPGMAKILDNLREIAQAHRRALAAALAGAEAATNPVRDSELASMQHPKSTVEPVVDDVLFYSNSFGVTDLSRTGNFQGCTAFWHPGFSADGAFDTGLVFFKEVFEAGGRDKPFSSGFLKSTGGNASKSDALYVAEVLAAGGICRELDAPIAYQHFQADHMALFGTMDPVNSIGVLVDGVSELKVSGSIPLLLLRRNIQFDLIPIKSIEGFDLRKYKLLCALNLPSLPASVTDAVAGFVRQHGGTLLISSGATSIAAATGSHSSRNEIADGHGRVVVYPEFAGQALNDGVLPDITAELLLADFKRFGGEMPVEIDGSDGLIALLWGKGTRRWVHVLNYRNEPGQATIQLPGCGGRQLIVHSPDETQPVMNVLETGSACAVFSLSGIQTYSIVEVI